MEQPVARNKTTALDVAAAPALPSPVETWIFDLDNTLYPASCRLFDQVDRRMGAFIQETLDLGPAEARALQKRYLREHGTTLRGLMDRHGIDPEVFLAHVHAIDLSPVAPDPALDAALGALPGRKIVYTNGSTAHAEAVLERLAVGRHFEAIFDIAAADYVPKPEPDGFRRLLDRYGVHPRQAVFLDDMARNLAPAAALGVTTVWVRHDSEWSHLDSDGDHVHAVCDELVTWLEARAGRR